MKLKISDEDVWNADDTLAKCIVKVLKKFRKRYCGHPVDMNPDDYAADIDDIISGFEGYINRWNSDNNSETMENFHRAMGLFVDHFQSFWD